METQAITCAKPAYPKVRVNVQVPEQLEVEASCVPSEELVTGLKVYHFVNLPLSSRF